MANQQPPNPFDKRFGRTPLVWAGRRDVLDLLDQSLRDDDRESMRQLLLHGPRGTGKTALIHEWAKRADAAGWAVVEVSPEPGELTQSVIDACNSIITRPSRRGRRRLKGGSAGIATAHVSAEFTEPTPSTNLPDAQQRVARLADKGVLFLIDEAHELDEDEVRRFGKAYQVSEAKVPDKMFAVGVAGLPYLSELMGDEYSSTFLARMEEIEVGLLTDDEITAGIRGALKKTGRRITNDALKLAVRESGGWPHVMQTIGYFAVLEARAATTINLEHVKSSLPAAHRAAGKALLRTVWRRLPHGIRWMLAALASHPGEVINKSDVERASGLSNGAFANTLTRALETGFITSIGGKNIIFPLPFARPWVLEAARRDNLADFSVGLADKTDATATAAGGHRSQDAQHPLLDETHVRNIAAQKLDAQSRARRKAQRCLHRGPRTKKRCIRPIGHNGQHRY